VRDYMEKLFIFLGIFALLFSNFYVDIAVLSLLGVSVIYDIIKRIKFSKRTFECLMCEHNFKPKWHKLLFSDWRSPRKYRTYKELNGAECERVSMRCPECKICNCVIKSDNIFRGKE
jgi:hypothetical protein